LSVFFVFEDVGATLAVATFGMATARVASTSLNSYPKFVLHKGL